jgi:hypothetical protein
LQASGIFFRINHKPNKPESRRLRRSSERAVEQGIIGRAPLTATATVFLDHAVW